MPWVPLSRYPACATVLSRAGNLGSSPAPACLPAAGVLPGLGAAKEGGAFSLSPRPPRLGLSPDWQIFGFLAAMCLILAVGNSLWEFSKAYYFHQYLPWPEGSVLLSGFLMFWSYVIILNTVVPISLYVR